MESRRIFGVEPPAAPGNVLDNVSSSKFDQRIDIVDLVEAFGVRKLIEGQPLFLESN